MILRYIFTTIILSATLLLNAQEVLTGLDVNPHIRQTLNEASIPVIEKSNQALRLPFFDDFSHNWIYPKASLWADNDVYTNKHYAVFPVTAGVATFDALDSYGFLHSNATDNRFIADYLTSRSIRLDSLFTPGPRPLSAADSIYLSFYYQPEGLGFAPADGDSLVLEFFHDHAVDSLKQWIKVWSAPGMRLNDFFALHGTYFKRVMIPITDTAYLKPGFRFRFYNIASIRFANAPSQQSNRDHWHVDYVYLNSNRNINDIYYRDIAFVNRPGSFLKNYHAMPYRQYKANPGGEMRDSLRVQVSNLHNSSTGGSYAYNVNRNNGAHLTTYETTTYSLPPFSQAGYVSQKAIARPPVSFAFPITNDLHNYFHITHILRSQNNFVATANDTLRFTQVFTDYYAYDDGSAEAGYGLTNVGGRLAYRFRLNTQDTLNAVRIFFNRALNNANQKYFHIQIWNELGGAPNEIIAEQTFFRVEYGDELNSFYTYHLDKPVIIDNVRFPGRVFYVGIEQTTADMLNIGFDRNNVARQQIFYSFDNSWLNTMFDGSLMIRPVMGTLAVGLADNPEKPNSPVRISPNPVTGNFINVSIGNTGDAFEYVVYNSSGMQVDRGNSTQTIDVAHLSAGIYVLRLSNAAGAHTTRFIVIR